MTRCFVARRLYQRAAGPALPALRRAGRVEPPPLDERWADDLLAGIVGVRR